MNYNNSELSDLLNQYYAEPEFNDRTEYLDDILDIMYTDLPVIPAYVYETQMAHHKDILNINPLVFELRRPSWEYVYYEDWLTQDSEETSMTWFFITPVVLILIAERSNIKRNL